VVTCSYSELEWREAREREVGVRDMWMRFGEDEG
jgi:hypothetical protein